jgi:hypothetical protein
MEDNSYDQSRIFKFNLIPPKTKEELFVLEERDNSILYSFLLVFFSVFIFFILTLIQTFVLDQRLQQTQQQIAQQEASFSAYDEIKRVRGELITKGELLEPVLKKDIKLTELLDLSSEVQAANSNVEILTYSRESTGDFILTFKVTDIESSFKLIEYLNNNEKLSNVFARNIVRTNNSITATISFSLINV